jgi:hypothetical protein
MAIKVPYRFGWTRKMGQTHCSEKTTLVVGGCSFTANGRNLDTCAATWPGILMDRSGFQHALDYSFAGAGNNYIADSILHHVDSMTQEDIKNTLIVIMWSGINRIDVADDDLSTDIADGAILNNKLYYRQDNPVKISTDVEAKKQLAQESAERIFQTHQLLSEKNISFAFSFYCNLLYPPYLPKRDLTHEFENHVDNTTLAQLRNLIHIPKRPMDFMFEYGFERDLLAEDYFHPNYDCLLNWTDEILLPGLEQMGLVTRLDIPKYTYIST